MHFQGHLEIPRVINSDTEVERMLLLMIITIIEGKKKKKRRKYECFLLCRFKYHLEMKTEIYFWDSERHEIKTITGISYDYQYYFKI